MKKLFISVILLAAVFLSGCTKNASPEAESTTVPVSAQETPTQLQSAEVQSEETQATQPTKNETSANQSAENTVGKVIGWNENWQYADFSKIHTGSAVLYRAGGTSRKNITVCVNAGHGTKGGSSQKTYCHPDKSAKVTGGSTSKGAVTATSINDGMTFPDGFPEAKANLSLALILKEKLLNAGYDVLMIRESDDVQLDNIARTVIANNNADCHISIHYDSTETDKGLFFMSVPNVASYRAMEPVKSHCFEHIRLGESLVEGERSVGVKIFSSGKMDIDLTQTSYSTVPSVDLEVGDKKSDHSQTQQALIADGIIRGLDIYYNN